MNLVAPESLVIWTTIIFILFFIILKKVAWKPILNAVKEREESINDALDSAEKARREMENLKLNNEKILKEAREERENMIKEGHIIKENIIAQAKKEAQIQASKIMDKATASIENEKQEAISELKLNIATLSLKIAQKVVHRELSNSKEQQALVSELLKEITLS